MIHNIKLNSKYFKDVITGIKTFEIRFNDRDYKVGDKLMLNEVYNNQYTNKQVCVKITYILTDEDFQEGIQKGYVVLGIQL